MLVACVYGAGWVEWAPCVGEPAAAAAAAGVAVASGGTRQASPAVHCQCLCDMYHSRVSYTYTHKVWLRPSSSWGRGGVSAAAGAALGYFVGAVVAVVAAAVCSGLLGCCCGLCACGCEVRLCITACPSGPDH